MKLQQLGPAFLVTAAFIGPGTIITASVAGANFGFTLIWALIFSVFASLILQEMAARLGIVTQQGLGENIRQSFTNPIAKISSIALVTSAIVVGNAAYQSGNISGASLGLASLIQQPLLSNAENSTLFPIVIGLAAFGILWRGNYTLVERVLMVLVGIMSIAFVATFVIAKPDIYRLISAVFKPTLPTAATLTVIALIGTTVVPYNLFLHASAVSKKWHSVDDIKFARRDLYFSIPLGGLISIAILSTSASAFFGSQISIHSAADLAPSLEPLLGQHAKTFMAFGLFSAGISSAITAPLAAAYALSGILNFNVEMNQLKFKIIWIVILTLGVLISSLGYKPISVILFAQIANGILLPVICGYLLYTMNSKKLGEFKNNFRQNILAIMVLLVTLMLSWRSLMSAFNLL